MYSSKHEKDRIGSLDGKILSTDIADFPEKSVLLHDDIVKWDINKQTWVNGQLNHIQMYANQQAITDLSSNTTTAITNAITNSVRSPGIATMLIWRNQSITVSIATVSATNPRLVPSFFLLVIVIFAFCVKAIPFGVLSKANLIYDS